MKVYRYNFRGNDVELLERKTLQGEIETLIVLTGTGAEYEDFLEVSGRTKANSVAVTTPQQFAFYPDLRVCHYGSYWLNHAYDSPEYNDRIKRFLMEDFENA